MKAPANYRLPICGINVDVVRKNIKHLNISVHAPAGNVRVSTPLRFSDRAVRLAVSCRLRWILRKQRAIVQQAQQFEQTIATGKPHYFQGRRYLLNVVECEGPAQVEIDDTSIQLRVPPTFDAAQRAAVLKRWHRERLKALIPWLLAKWQVRVGVSVAEVRVKKMKTLWGSCNFVKGRVWLNLELIQKPIECLEYVFVHELVHLHVPSHNHAFRARMDALLPEWRKLKATLNLSKLTAK